MVLALVGSGVGECSCLLAWVLAGGGGGKGLEIEDWIDGRRQVMSQPFMTTTLHVDFPRGSDVL